MFEFPYTNLHELNLDWILSIVKEATDIFKHGEADIQHAVETSEQALETAEQAAQGVVADGSITVPKLNDDVLKMFAYVVSGRVNELPIPKDSFVIVRLSTIPSVSDGLYQAVADIPANTMLTDLDLKQPTELGHGTNNVLLQICNAIESGLLTIVDGDTASSGVPAGGLAFIKNNEHGLATGFYTNTSGSTFPTSGGTADSSTFTRVFDVLNTLSTITGDGVLSGFTATDLTGATNELKNSLNTVETNLLHLKNLAKTANAVDYNTIDELTYNLEVGANCPTANGYMLVFPLRIPTGGEQDETVAQFAFDLYHTTSDVYYRLRTNHIWRSWKKIGDDVSENFSSAITAGQNISSFTAAAFKYGKTCVLSYYFVTTASISRNSIIASWPSTIYALGTQWNAKTNYTSRVAVTGNTLIADEAIANGTTCQGQIAFIMS